MFTLLFAVTLNSFADVGAKYQPTMVVQQPQQISTLFIATMPETLTMLITRETPRASSQSNYTILSQQVKTTVCSYACRDVGYKNDNLIIPNSNQENNKGKVDIYCFRYGYTSFDGGAINRQAKTKYPNQNYMRFYC